MPTAPPTTLRQFILAEIVRLSHAAGGQTPGEIKFSSATGITAAKWRKYWPRWSLAVKEAGYEANVATPARSNDEIMAALATIIRHYERLPTEAEIAIFRNTDRSIPGRTTLRRRFPTKADLVRALVEWASQQPDRADIGALLPVPSDLDQGRDGSAREGFVYLFKCGPDYKIGRTGDLERRFKTIGVAMPERMDLVHSIRTDDPPGIEAYWHRRFADTRRNGEWFKLRPQDVAAFRRRRYQ